MPRPQPGTGRRGDVAHELPLLADPAQQHLDLGRTGLGGVGVEEPPSSSWSAPTFTGFRAPRTPERGAAAAIRLATPPDGGPTGSFFQDDGVVPWWRGHRAWRSMHVR
ncbi:hypothetical protein [Umezawaea beigongshangensis]|uniref:hypothetical protein n=1 Tax=Umezawaea beigongshangensis TaxID=2780383 RepID=UPI0018F108B1|nr:hypothetical protein [Umezawaea beigongshangensis]